MNKDQAMTLKEGDWAFVVDGMRQRLIRLSSPRFDQKASAVTVLGDGGASVSIPLSSLRACSHTRLEEYHCETGGSEPPEAWEWVNRKTYVKIGDRPKEGL